MLEASMRDQPQDHLQELRLVGVHDDGQHLLLTAGSGGTFRLPLDEALRRAIARPAPQRPAPSGAANMSPRQIQAEIRAGATAESIAEASGIPLARVQRYETPVLAEREHMVRLAQGSEIAPPPPAQSAFAAEFGPGPAHLGDMVAHRLAVHGVDPSTVEWDSWRRRDGLWTVVARFELPADAPDSIGEEPPATWTFNPVRRSVTNANRWAQQLSELETLDGPTSPRRLSVVDRPFDVEAEPARASQPDAHDAESDLLDMLRARRGQRLGVDENADDALALLLTQGIPAAHPRPAENHSESEARDGEARPRRLEPVRDSITSIFPRLSREEDASRTPEDGHLRLAPGLSTSTREITIVPAVPFPGAGRDDDVDDAADERSGEAEASEAGASHDESEPTGGADDAPTTAESPAPSATAPETATADEPATEPQRRTSRPRRSSIPSWDEIVFGTKGD
ncbi:septation protein SepH [Sinomonas sp. JGH33]|uniref:Septation protein SepH n=1 Tax=Sinomonas terricola TaxID=3110330 RepID=A0ABU5T3Z3_9MICC|nr:septation protein SepH [Sinomonas sp. JGH33]MEA5454272.1 septation protein SepH [Sinomonas sp. JGH33]